VNCPTSFVCIANLIKGFIVSFPSMYVMQFSLGVYTSILKLLTRPSSYIFCRPVYPICPYLWCHVF
jgi:hypothetical protein